MLPKSRHSRARNPEYLGTRPGEQFGSEFMARAAATESITLNT